jgi:hypothetical protein
MNARYALLIITGCLIGILSCKKWQDKPGIPDPRINERKYCNDPRAINYNWGFPGVSDSTVCMYPAQVFKGKYIYTDSIYFPDFTQDTLHPEKTYTLLINEISYNKLSLEGFCEGNQAIFLTASRYNYRATIDTTIHSSDTTVDYGQFFCRQLDTLTGYLSKSQGDSTHLLIEFTVVSDTGIRIHKGTALRIE